MSKRIGLLFLFLIVAAPGFAQNRAPTRDQTHDLLQASLARYGPTDGVNISFGPVNGHPYNFTGSATAGLKNSDSLEVVLVVSDQSTITVLVYPHYKGGYINLDRVKDPNGFMRKLLTMNSTTFFSWGADDSNDVFASFNFTLESGYPDEAMNIVLRSIRNLNGYVGQLRPLIDGSAGQ